MYVKRRVNYQLKIHFRLLSYIIENNQSFRKSFSGLKSYSYAHIADLPYSVCCQNILFLFLYELIFSNFVKLTIPLLDY